MKGTTDNLTERNYWPNIGNILARVADNLFHTRQKATRKIAGWLFGVVILLGMIKSSFRKALSDNWQSILATAFWFALGLVLMWHFREVLTESMFWAFFAAGFLAVTTVGFFILAAKSKNTATSLFFRFEIDLMIIAGGFIIASNFDGPVLRASIFIGSVALGIWVNSMWEKGVWLKCLDLALLWETNFEDARSETSQRPLTDTERGFLLALKRSSFFRVRDNVVEGRRLFYCFPFWFTKHVLFRRLFKTHFGIEPPNNPEFV